MTERPKPEGYYDKSTSYIDPTRRRTVENGVIKPFNIPERRALPEAEAIVVTAEELAEKRDKAFNDKP